MTAVFVHGVPEDQHLWDELRAELPTTQTAALNLPGFGAPLPEGFAATKDGYVAWIVRELEEFGKPVDLVGHDWGALFVTRIAFTRPDLIRSWVTDAIGICDDAFTWHELARIWQTPEVGEAYWAQQAQLTDEQRTANLVSAGMSERYARRIAGNDPRRNQCILELYRSAVTVYDDWFKDITPSKKPGLAVVATEDRYVNPTGVRAAAERVGIATATLDGLGHWWSVTAPKRGAEVLQAFWASIG